jgi:hypothetical protein
MTITSRRIRKFEKIRNETVDVSRDKVTRPNAGYLLIILITVRITKNRNRNDAIIPIQPRV